MSDQRTTSKTRLFAIGAVLIMLAALIAVSVMSAAVVSVSESAAEVVRVAGHLDSPASLRDILYAYTRQYGVAETQLNRVISYALGFLTLAVALVTALAVTVFQLRERISKLEAQLAKLKEAPRRR